MSGIHFSDAFRGAALALLLGAACVADFRHRRIPNALVLAIAVIGVASAALWQPGVHGLVNALGGLGTGLAIWLPFWLLGMLGAGDVKLFAAGAAWLGPRAAVEGALLTAFAGGAVALVILIARFGPGLTLMRIGHAIQHPATLRVEDAPAEAYRLPYSFAITAGLLAAGWWPGVLI